MRLGRCRWTASCDGAAARASLRRSTSRSPQRQLCSAWSRGGGVAVETLKRGQLDLFSSGGLLSAAMATRGTGAGAQSVWGATYRLCASGGAAPRPSPLCNVEDSREGKLSMDYRNAQNVLNMWILIVSMFFGLGSRAQSGRWLLRAREACMGLVSWLGTAVAGAPCRFRTRPSGTRDCDTPFETQTR
jgi:hypothetical protein